MHTCSMPIAAIGWCTGAVSADLGGGGGGILCTSYGCHQTLIDATGVGDAVLDEVRDVAQGFVFTRRSKLDLLTGLQVALEKRELVFPFVRELVDELQDYAWDDDKLQTDCVMSLALAVWAAGPRTGVEFAPSLWG